MSLSTTSDSSMVKIMKCLDNKSDRNTLHNLMKCSHKVNNVVDENGLSKISEATVDIDLGNKWIILDATVSFREHFANKEGELIRSHKWEKRVFAIPDNASKTMEKILLYLQSKAKSIKSLELCCLTLNADMLEVFVKHVNFIRTIAHLDLFDTRIEWNTDQFLQFMKLFDNLNTFSIEANLPVTCRITDEMLSLVKSSVDLDCTYIRDNTPCPLITSSICDFWIKNKTLKSINFEGISTQMLFPSVRQLIEHRIDDPEFVGDMYFGSLKCSSDFHRELAIFQNKRGCKISVTKSLRLCNVKITHENSGSKFGFEVVCPMKMSFFETMLDDLQKLRVACEPFQNADLEIRGPFIEMFQEYVKNLGCYYYCFTENITGTATADGFRNEMMQEINTLEEEILVIMDKLKTEGMESDNLAEH